MVKITNKDKLINFLKENNFINKVSHIQYYSLSISKTQGILIDTMYTLKNNESFKDSYYNTCNNNTRKHNNINNTSLVGYKITYINLEQEQQKTEILFNKEKSVIQYLKKSFFSV